MRKVCEHIAGYIARLWSSKWRWIVIACGLALFFILWTLPLYLFPETEIFNTLGELYVFGYILGPFYALSIWHVVSEDERDLTLGEKIRSSLFIAFNKLLFALVVFLLFVILVGTLRGEL